MSIEEALKLVQTWVFAKTSKHLDKLQIAVLRGAWENQTYEQIAEAHCFSSAHAKAVGANLWDFLSEVFGTKVNKKNFHVVLQHKIRSADPGNLAETRLSLSGAEEPRVDLKPSDYSFCTEAIREPEKLSSYPALTNSQSLELPGGPVPLDSAFYIERPPIEERAYKAISQPGNLIRIHAPRQMGKTSLMARILHQAREQGYRTVTLNFQLAARNIFTNLDRFLQWFCASVSKSLGLPNQLSDYWDDILGSNYSSTDYFEKFLLAQIDSPLVLGLDDVDVVFQYPEIAWDFLGLLRAWYEKAKYGNSRSDVWKKLRLVVVYSSEIYLPLNINQSPFNVGLSIELPEFTNEQVQDLTQRHGLDWDARQVDQLTALVGGNPYLIRMGLHHIWQGDVTLDQLLSTAATKGGIYAEYLHRQLWNLQQYPELCAAFVHVVNSSTPVELKLLQALKLHSMGLVRLQDNQVIPSCDLYRQYFRAFSTSHREAFNSQLCGLANPAHLDEQTQLANRHYFEEYLYQEWQRLKRVKAPISLILCNIDFQTEHHTSGNSSLQQVAYMIACAAKRPADLVARYAEDKFAVILPYTDAAGATHVAETIRLGLKANVEMLQATLLPDVPITLSLGVSSIVPNPESSPAMLITTADEALSQAKSAEHDS